MKKNIILILVCLFTGIFLGFFMYNTYQKKEFKLKSIHSKIEKLYFIQIGVYSDLEKMKQNLNHLANYIYTEENKLYYAYVGITREKENEKKLKEYFENLGYDIYVKELEIENKEFNQILNDYDKLLKETKDNQAISTICNQVLRKYKELVINVESKTNTQDGQTL